MSVSAQHKIGRLPKSAIQGLVEFVRPYDADVSYHQVEHVAHLNKRLTRHNAAGIVPALTPAGQGRALLTSVGDQARCSSHVRAVMQAKT